MYRHISFESTAAIKSYKVLATKNNNPQSEINKTLNSIQLQICNFLFYNKIILIEL